MRRAHAERQITAHQLAADLREIAGYCRSDQNPADKTVAPWLRGLLRLEEETWVRHDACCWPSLLLAHRGNDACAHHRRHCGTRRGPYVVARHQDGRTYWCHRGYFGHGALCCRSAQENSGQDHARANWYGCESARVQKNLLGGGLHLPGIATTVQAVRRPERRSYLPFSTLRQIRCGDE